MTKQTMNSPSLQKTLLKKSAIPFVLIWALCIIFYGYASIKNHKTSEFETLKDLSFSSRHIIQSHLSDYKKKNNYTNTDNLAHKPRQNIRHYFESLTKSPHITAITLLDNQLNVVEHVGSSLIARLNPNQFNTQEPVIITTKHERIFVLALTNDPLKQDIKPYWLLISLSEKQFDWVMLETIFSSLIFSLLLIKSVIN